MRYDSDPYIITKFLKEAELLDNFLNDPQLTGTISPQLFRKLEPFATPFLGTLDHFTKLHLLNPQFSVSPFSAHQIEQKLSALQTSILTMFSRQEFPSFQEQAQWKIARFLNPGDVSDHEYLFITIYQKLAQILGTYYVEQVRKKHFAALLNEVVGWTEHIETHGHHDIHAVILFAEKIARERAIIDHRAEVVREICGMLQDQFTLHAVQEAHRSSSERIALKVSRIYSAYLLDIYETLLEDMEIIVMADQDYHAFEAYCQEQQIEVYEEYHDEIRNQLKQYIKEDAASIPLALNAIRQAILIGNALTICERYHDVEMASEVLGFNLNEDIRVLQHAIRDLQDASPDLSERFIETMQTIKAVRKGIIKPAIQVYSQYLQDSTKFFEQFAQKHRTWLPILERALACLEPEDDLYQKCYTLKQQIDQHTHHETGVKM